MRETLACMRRLRLAVLGLALSLCSDVAVAKDVSGNAYPSLPLDMKEYQALVQRLAAEVNGRHAAMAKKLGALGFTCSAASQADWFLCVRFGCRRGGFFWRGARLQWIVQARRGAKGEFDALVLDYTASAGCISPGDLEDAQKRVVFGKAEYHN